MEGIFLWGKLELLAIQNERKKMSLYLKEDIKLLRKK